MSLTIVSLFIIGTCVGAGVLPWEPTPKTGSWLQTHEKFVNNTKEHKDEIKVLFIGASITTFWQKEGKAIWNSYYVKRGAVDYGIPGDTTSNVLWRIENGEVDGLKPKIIVVQVGFNNLWAYKPTSTIEEVAKGINEVVKQLGAKMPESKIINVGMTPVKEAAKNAKVKPINELLAKDADNKNVFFLDVNTNMTDSEGRPKPGVQKPDGIHPTTLGYEIWQEAMRPLFEKLYEEEK